LRPVIAVHGGAGFWPLRKHRLALKGVEDAAMRGYSVLAKGGTAFKAVEEATISMEDSSVFNAGVGSNLNLKGQEEMDASIMDGRTLRAGAVALVKSFKNPVSLARLVMEKTDHVLLAGIGAQRLGELYALQRAAPVNGARLEEWKKLKLRLLSGKIGDMPKTLQLLRKHPEIEVGTVGAIAIDMNEDVAAATSTGGIALKFPGRIGDTPLIGCGTYADDESGAASATGVGEGAIRSVLAKTACDLMSEGAAAQKAAERAVELESRRIGLPIGIITLDRKGNVGAAHSTPNICWAFMRKGLRKPDAKMKAEYFQIRKSFRLNENFNQKL